jgi:hypothetical protein
VTARPLEDPLEVLLDVAADERIGGLDLVREVRGSPILRCAALLGIIESDSRVVDRHVCMASAGVQSVSSFAAIVTTSSS